MSQYENQEKEFSFKDYFVPLTTLKVIHFIVIIGLLVYFNSLFNGFVGDDSGQIVDNPLIHSITNFPSFFKGSTLFIEQVGASAGLYYRPMLSTTLSIIYSIFGPNPFFFHSFQLLLHIINCILIFFIFKRHINKNISFILSILFLLHPINNEAVVYISNLQEELFAFFGLLALNFISVKKLFFFIPGLLLLSLLSKESGIIFVPVVILYYFFFAEKSKDRTKYLLTSIAGAVALYIFSRVLIGNTGLQTKLLYMSENASLVERLFTLPSIIFYYLKMVFFPISIAFGWFWVIKNPNFENFGLPMIAVLLFFITLLIPIHTLRTNKRLRKVYLFFLLFFLFSISIILQIFPLDLTVADRWFYMPLFGLLGLIGVVYETFHRRIMSRPYLKTGMIIIVITIILFFAGRNFIRNSNWVNNLTICQHDAQINTKSYILEFCSANELYNIKKYDEAKIRAQKAINLYPDYFFSWYVLGKIHFAQNDKVNARKAFEKTLTLNDFSLGSEEVALILVYEKKPKEAKALTQKYLKKLPHSTELWYALALAEYSLGNKEEALIAAKKAYDLQPTPMTEKVYIRLRNNLPISF